jgi:hypothetical protein
MMSHGFSVGIRAIKTNRAYFGENYDRNRAACYLQKIFCRVGFDRTQPSINQNKI